MVFLVRLDSGILFIERSFWRSTEMVFEFLIVAIANCTPVVAPKLHGCVFWVFRDTFFTLNRSPLVVTYWSTFLGKQICCPSHVIARVILEAPFLPEVMYNRTSKKRWFENVGLNMKLGMNGLWLSIRPFYPTHNWWVWNQVSKKTKTCTNFQDCSNSDETDRTFWKDTTLLEGG